MSASVPISLKKLCPQLLGHLEVECLLLIHQGVGITSLFFFSPLAGYMNSDPKRYSFQANRVIHELKLKTLFMMLQGSSLTGKHHKFQ